MGSAPVRAGSAPARAGSAPVRAGSAIGTGSGGAPDGAGGGSGGTVPDGVYVDLAAERQIIRGFGFNTALRDSGACRGTISSRPTTATRQLALSILRVGMKTDGTLTGYGISEAKAANPDVRIIGSTWTPAGDWKTSGTTTNGGHVKPEYYGQWADRIAAFAAQYDLYAMSVANESDFSPALAWPSAPRPTTRPSTTPRRWWSSSRSPDRRSKAASPSTLVMAPEASEWIHAWSNISGTGSTEASHPNSSDPYNSGCFGNEITPELEAHLQCGLQSGRGLRRRHALWADQTAWNAFDIVGVHEYDSQKAFAWPADVNGGVRNKEVWQTEMSGVMHWPEHGPSTRHQ